MLVKHALKSLFFYVCFSVGLVKRGNGDFKKKYIGEMKAK